MSGTPQSLLAFDRLARGGLAFGHFASGAFDVAFHLLRLTFPLHLLVAAQLPAGILQFAFRLVAKLAHAAPP